MSDLYIGAPTDGDLPSLSALWAEAFGDTEEDCNAFFSIGFSPERARVLKIDGTLAAMLYWFDCQYEERPLAYLYAIATANAFRRRGLCRSLMEDTHRHLTSLGYVGTLLVPATPALFAFYEGLGYHTAAFLGERDATAAATPVALRPITKEEYAACRRALLPPRGVIEEGALLSLLETYAELYAGDGFVLAGVRHSHRFYGIELLGDPSLAPHILCALGCTEGHFRTCGNDRPFAMYRSLTSPALPAPRHFGLALD